MTICDVLWIFSRLRSQSPGAWITLWHSFMCLPSFLAVRRRQPQYDGEISPGPLSLPILFSTPISKNHLTASRWNVAFNLARDLKLNEEVRSPMMPHDTPNGLPSLNCKCSLIQHSEADVMNEVHREERRRTWWLLFLMDRHLALCYNRSLALLEAECRDLLLPLDDVTWQSGVQPHSHGTRPDGPRCMLLPSGKGRSNGPPKTCSGLGLFEFFLPLMVHCGTLLDLNRSRLHPVLSGAAIWSSKEREISNELDHFQATLNQVTGESTTEKDPDHGSIWGSSSGPGTEDSETTHIAKTVAGYATHIVNVLRILVGSKCEPCPSEF